MTKKQKAKLKAQILSGVVFGGVLLGSTPASAEITGSQSYDASTSGSTYYIMDPIVKTPIFDSLGGYPSC